MNPYQLAKRDHEDHILRNTDEGRVEEPEEKTGFVENFERAWGDYHAEEASHSQFFNNRRIRAPRNEQVQQLIDAEEFTEEELEANMIYGPLGGVSHDYEGLAQLRQAKGFDDVQTEEQLQEGLREELRERRETSQDIYDRSSLAGTVGAFGGSMAASTADPVNIAAIAIPVAGPTAAVGRAAGRTSLARAAARVGGSAAGANILAESAIQAQVVEYKKEIESPYSAGMAAANIAFAGAFGAALGAGSGAWRQHSINRNLPNEALNDLHAARGLTEEGSAERLAIDESIARIDPKYSGPIDDVGLDRMAEAEARAKALPDREYSTVEGDITSSKAAGERSQKMADDIEQIVTCMYGAQ